MIQVQNLGKSFDRRTVVSHLSFAAQDGAITGLLGANGAGKSTTLRMICGVLKPESGTVIVDDVATTRDPLARQRRIGALLDHVGIYSRLTVRENLIYFGQLRGMPREFIKDAQPSRSQPAKHLPCLEALHGSYGRTASGGPRFPSPALPGDRV